MHVYITTNLINSKKYIGYSVRNDDRYFGSGNLILAAIKKYGKENFKKEILEECSSIEDVSKAEKKWISFYNAVLSKDFYNISYGGYGGDPILVKKYWEALSIEKRKTIGSKISMKIKEGIANGSILPFSGRPMSKIVKKMWETKSSEERHLIARKGVETRKSLGISYKGKNNPNHVSVVVHDLNGQRKYECLKDYHYESNIPYSSLVGILRRHCDPNYVSQNRKHKDVKIYYA